MITIKEFYGDVKDIDESVLAVKSERFTIGYKESGYTTVISFTYSC